MKEKKNEYPKESYSEQTTKTWVYEVDENNWYTATMKDGVVIKKTYRPTKHLYFCDSVESEVEISFDILEKLYNVVKEKR